MSEKSKARRVSFFATPDEYNQLRYFISQSPQRWSSASDFIRAATAHYISFLNQDYDLPALEIQRLNQLVDTITVLSSNVGSLQDVVTHGFDSLLQLTRGSNYLLEIDDDGEL